LRALGLECVVLLLEGGRFGLARQFQQEGADVLWIKKDDGKIAKHASNKIVVHACGKHTIEPILDTDLSVDSVINFASVADEMLRLRYIDTMDDPLLPAISKFYHVNKIGPPTVFPGPHGCHQAASLVFTAEGKHWVKNPGDLAFVLPVHSTSVASKGLLATYGSNACAMVCRGGGPFFLRSSPTLADEVLTRLGFLDAHLNSDFGEAVDVLSK